MRNISETTARRTFDEAVNPVYIRLFHIAELSEYGMIRLYSTSSYIGLRRYGNSDDFDACVSNILSAYGNARKPLVAKKTTYYAGVCAKTDKEYNEFIAAVKEIFSTDNINALPEHSFAVRFYIEFH